MSKSALEQIKEAEEKARQIVEQDHQTAQGISKAAQTEAADLVAQSERRAREQVDAKRQAYLSKLSGEYESLKRENDAKCQRLKQEALGNLEKAKDFVLGRIL